MQKLDINPADLAPGDSFAADFDWSRFEVAMITSPADPDFDEAYERLWDEFSYHDSMESRQIIESRLTIHPTHDFAGGWRMLYRMIAVSERENRAAVRDATAILHRSRVSEVFVHLSHVLVEPAYRGGKLAAWLRAFPVQIARECHELAGFGGAPANITLVAEMEHPSPSDPMSTKRLASYERAGFLKVDPSAVDYYQPDFRPPAAIDAAGGPKPLPYLLILRRVGRENERTISGGEIRQIVTALYAMYGRHFRPQDMLAAEKTLPRYPADAATVQLLPPTA
jgi:hypothetical protein